MPLIQEMLRAEASVTSQAELLLRDLGRHPIDAMEQAAQAYAAAAEAIRASPIDRQLVENSQRLLRAIEEPDLARLNRNIKNKNTGANRTLKAAGDAWLEFWSRYAQKVAFQLVWRHFRRGVSEIYRLHITSAAGRLRQQVEAAALLEIFQRRNRQGVHSMIRSTTTRSCSGASARREEGPAEPQPGVRVQVRVCRRNASVHRLRGVRGLLSTDARLQEVSLADEDFSASDPFLVPPDGRVLPANAGAHSQRARHDHVGTANAGTEGPAGGAEQDCRNSLVGAGAGVRGPRSRPAQHLPPRSEPRATE